MEQKIKQVIARVFELKEEDIKDIFSTETVEEWDSLKHMNLVLALEDEFNIEFEDDDIADMISYQKILDVLNKCSQN